MYIFCRSVETLAGLLHSLGSKVQDENLYITVRRSHLLQDALREERKSKFNAKMQIKVCVCMCMFMYVCFYVCV